MKIWFNDPREGLIVMEISKIAYRQIKFRADASHESIEEYCTGLNMRGVLNQLLTLR